MADLTITAANVKLGTSSIQPVVGVLGATISAGTVVYLDANQVLQKANCDAVGTADPVGITVTGGVSGDKVFYLTNGSRYVTGATMTAFAQYVLSNNDGNLMPATDLVSTNYFVPCIVALTTTLAEITINATGQVKA